MTTGQQWYAEYLRSPRWRFLRWARRRIDGNRCRVCNRSERLEMHHRSYAHCNKSLLAELLDLITLCNRCHGDFHNES